MSPIPEAKIAAEQKAGTGGEIAKATPVVRFRLFPQSQSMSRSLLENHHDRPKCDR